MQQLLRAEIHPFKTLKRIAERQWQQHAHAGDSYIYHVGSRQLRLDGYF